MKSDQRPTEAGWTLVELLVVIILLGIVGGIVTSIIVTALQTAATSTARTEALHEIETSLQRVSREIRVADPLWITEVPSRELGVSIRRGDELVLVRFQADPTERLLRQRNQVYTPETLLAALDELGEPLGSESVSLVTDFDNQLTNSLAADFEPLFKYFDARGNELTCALDADGIPDDALECFSTLRRTRQVGISIVKEVPGADRPVSSEVRVSIRSTRYAGATS